MTFALALPPLAAFAMVFQTLVYMAVPERIRTRIAPMITGVVGATVVMAAGLWFGFDEIGLTGGSPAHALAWGVAAALVVSVMGSLMLQNDDLWVELVDEGMAKMSDLEAGFQILIRIPVFTALVEEAFFRGLLHAVLIALYPTQIAFWAGAVLFGLWHVGPGLHQASANRKTSVRRVAHLVGTVVATTVAGAALVWLRIETGSIWAPFAVHAAINMTMALYSWMASRRLAVGDPNWSHAGGGDR